MTYRLAKLLERVSAIVFIILTLWIYPLLPDQIMVWGKSRFQPKYPNILILIAIFIAFNIVALLFQFRRDRNGFVGKPSSSFAAVWSGIAFAWNYQLILSVYWTGCINNGVPPWLRMSSLQMVFSAAIGFGILLFFVIVSIIEDRRWYKQRTW